MSFAHHLALLDAWLDRRPEVVETIERSLLNVQGKPLSRLRDRQAFGQVLDGCLYGLSGLPRELASLKGQLAARHIADGFEPLRLERFPNELDPLELVVRAYNHWDRHRWPGRSGRVSYADAIFVACILRQLEYLTLRVWDDGLEGGSGWLHELQIRLDRLNERGVRAPLVRDVGWLIQTAQGPVTRRLGPYFDVAERIAGSFTGASRLAIHAAGAKLTGGHLRSQLRYATWRMGRPLDAAEVLASTRNSNSMDVGLLIRDLAHLLPEYVRNSDAGNRLPLADAILQGLSADPGLLVARFDLLGPSLMIEDLFIERAEHGIGLTWLGRIQEECVERYCEALASAAPQLLEDARRLDPATRRYSPFGIGYGFCADILSNMAADVLVAQQPDPLALEDVFTSVGDMARIEARVSAWRRLPKREGEREHFEHCPEYASLIFERLIRSLEGRVEHPTVPNASGRRSARLFVLSDGDRSAAPANAVRVQEHVLTSDVKRATATGETALPKSQIHEDRHEGRYLGSTEVEGGWSAVSKVVLTLQLDTGQDAVIGPMPREVVDVLRVTLGDLLAN